MEQRVMVSRIATHSSCGGCTVHVVGYASAAKVCTELLITLLPYQDLATMKRARRVESLVGLRSTLST